MNLGIASSTAVEVSDPAALLRERIATRAARLAVVGLSYVGLPDVRSRVVPA